jgi:hypothetical protein
LINVFGTLFRRAERPCAHTHLKTAQGPSRG